MVAAFDGIADVNRRQYIDRAGLEPVIQSFGGSTLQQRLRNGAFEAGRVLSKYVSSLSYDQVAAEELFSKVEAWQSANQYQFESIIRSGADTVPEQVKLAFGDNAARQFIVSSYAEACRGLPAWSGGAIADSIKFDPRMSQSIAQADAENRLVVFSQIVLLERQGALSTIFRSSGTSGLGAAFLAAIPSAGYVAITIIGAALIAGFVVLARSWLDLKQTDMWIKERCAKNPEKCDETLKLAIENMFGGRSPGGGGSAVFSEVGSQIGMYLGLGLLAYVGVTLVLPAARDALKEKTA